MSPADQQTDDVREDLDRYRTRAGDKASRARDQAEEKYDEAKEKGRGVWGSIKDFFGELQPDPHCSQPWPDPNWFMLLCIHPLLTLQGFHCRVLLLF